MVKGKIFVMHTRDMTHTISPTQLHNWEVDPPNVGKCDGKRNMTWSHCVTQQCGLDENLVCWLSSTPPHHRKVASMGAMQVLTI